MTKKIDKYLRDVVKMDERGLSEQYTILLGLLRENTTDFIEAQTTRRLLQAVEAIGDARFMSRWRFAGMAIHHIDGNPRNNSPSNLRMVRIDQHHR